MPGILDVYNRQGMTAMRGLGDVAAADLRRRQYNLDVRGENMEAAEKLLSKAAGAVAGEYGTNPSDIPTQTQAEKEADLKNEMSAEEAQRLVDDEAGRGHNIFNTDATNAQLQGALTRGLFRGPM